METRDQRQLKVNKPVLEQNQLSLYSLLHYRGRAMGSPLIWYLTLGNNHSSFTFIIHKNRVLFQNGRYYSQSLLWWTMFIWIGLA